MRGGIDPGDDRFYPRFVVVAYVWKYLESGDGTLSSAGGAGSTNPSQSAISQWGWGFHTVRGSIDRGTTVFLHGVLELYMYGIIYHLYFGDETIRPGGRWVMLAPWLGFNPCSAQIFSNMPAASGMDLASGYNWNRPIGYAFFCLKFKASSNADFMAWGLRQDCRQGSARDGRGSARHETECSCGCVTQILYARGKAGLKRSGSRGHDCRQIDYKQHLSILIYHS